MVHKHETDPDCPECLSESEAFEDGYAQGQHDSKAEIARLRAALAALDEGKQKEGEP